MVDDGPIRCSVIIPCLDGGATLRRQLDALAAQRAPVRFEIVVADNGSRDDSAAIASGYPGLVRLVDASAARGINVARNAGVRAARGELLLLCDADDEVHPGWLAAYWRAYERGGTLFGGALRRVSADGEHLRWQRTLNDDLAFLPWPTGANCGLARAVVDEVGLFDESLRGGADETELFWRAQLRGHALALVEDAAVDYTARSSARGAFRQSVAYGRSHALLFARFRSRGMPRSRPVSSLLVWLRLVKAVVVAPTARSSRIALLRCSGVLWGRITGSAAHGLLYV